MATDHDEQTRNPLMISPTDDVLYRAPALRLSPPPGRTRPQTAAGIRIVANAVADIFDALIATLGETRVEPDLEGLLWSTVNLFHRATERIERDLDGNELAQRRSQKDQDGSEIRSVELERLIAEGMTLSNAATPSSSCAIGPPNTMSATPAPPGGPARDLMVNHRALTAAMIDSRDFIAAKRKADTDH